MSDLISRQKVIDTEGLDEQIRCEMCRNPMHTDRGCDGNCKYDEKLYERIIQILGERIKPSPSAESERKKGKWIYDHEYAEAVTHKCSECGKRMTTGIGMKANFCWNCGADMRGGEE